MRLDLPSSFQLPDGASVLIAGMGGGFDVFCGLPIFFELQQRGYTVHLANLSFAPLQEYTDCMWISPTLVGVGPAPLEFRGYHPERYLSSWFRECRGEERTIWCVDAAGGIRMTQDYRTLVQRFRLDAIILVDGGVDSLTRGDEELCGTILEDYLSLGAVSTLQEVPVRILACIGMGVEGDVDHAQVLENIAAIAHKGGHLGTTALLEGSHPFKLYLDALSYVHNRPEQQPSVVNASIVSSVLGKFGDYHLTERTRGSELSISPWMSLYWFFTVDSAAEQNLFLKTITETNSMGELFAATYEARDKMQLRPGKPARIG